MLPPSSTHLPTPTVDHCLRGTVGLAFGASPVCGWTPQGHSTHCSTSAGLPEQSSLAFEFVFKPQRPSFSFYALYLSKFVEMNPPPCRKALSLPEEGEQEDSNVVVSAVGHQAPVCGLPPRASRQSHAPTLLLSWATKDRRCLGHFSSHLNRRRWEGRKEESI